MSSRERMNPIDIVARYAALDQMRKMKPEDINKVDADFIISYFIDTKDPAGNIVSQEVYETNWYYALFTAPMYKIDKLFAAFEAKSKVIIPEVPKIIV